MKPTRKRAYRRHATPAEEFERTARYMAFVAESVKQGLFPLPNDGSFACGICGRSNVSPDLPEDFQARVFAWISDEAA